MESELLLPRVNDAVKICERDNRPVFFGFLSELETAKVYDMLKNKTKFIFFGGYEDAERVMLCVLPDWADENNFPFPISSVTFKYRNDVKLSHRDFLGALMALGIKRETVGDILTENGRAVVFLKNEVLSFVLEQIDKVGSQGVEIRAGFDSPLPQMSMKQTKTDFVASMRLDSVVAALTNNSRNSALQLLSESRVSVNGIICDKPTRKVVSSDKITVKGYGKFTVLSSDETSKKGRIILKSEKYI